MNPYWLWRSIFFPIDDRSLAVLAVMMVAIVILTIAAAAGAFLRAKRRSHFRFSTYIREWFSPEIDPSMKRIDNEIVHLDQTDRRIYIKWTQKHQH